MGKTLEALGPKAYGSTSTSLIPTRPREREHLRSMPVKGALNHDDDTLLWRAYTPPIERGYDSGGMKHAVERWSGTRYETQHMSRTHVFQTAELLGRATCLPWVTSGGRDVCRVPGLRRSSGFHAPGRVPRTIIAGPPPAGQRLSCPRPPSRHVCAPSLSKNNR